MKYINIIVLAALLLFAGCGKTTDTDTNKIEKLEVTGLKNVYRLTSRIVAGGEPEGESGFDSLRKMGVTTVLSVTGKAPDEALAKKYGLKYVHVPMDYEGMSEEQKRKILNTVSNADGSVYIHCNSGRNRGATAAALCMIGSEGRSKEAALNWMKQRGVDEQKEKLWEAVKLFTPDDKEK